MSQKIEIGKDLLFRWSRHGVERWIERNTTGEPASYLLYRCRPGSSDFRKVLAKRCPGHRSEMYKIYDAPNVYWYDKDKDAGIWRVFVTVVESTGEYKILTYFEVDYTLIAE